MFLYHIWITVLLPFKEARIISGLVNKGYTVSPAAENNELTLLADVNAPYGIIACRVYKELGSVKELYDDIYNILTIHKITYYSLIISEFSADSLWNAGNAVDGKFLSFTDNTPIKKIVN